MLPVGYMAKHVYTRPNWLKAPHVADIFSVSACQSENFADYISFWKHNGFWFFDSPEIIQATAAENKISLDGTSLFYYEVHEEEFDGDRWRPVVPEPSFTTNVIQPLKRNLDGFDVVTFYVGTNPECSPLSCNGIAEEIRTNKHCLFDSFDQAQQSINSGIFKDAEPGPYRIFAVYSVDWA